jgi:hypothetical protein
MRRTPRFYPTSRSLAQHCFPSVITWELILKAEPISISISENLGDRVLDLVESAQHLLSPVDSSRAEVMEMCLQSSTGEYKPIDVEQGLK